MSGQLLELLIFAGIAIFLVNKLISILGTSSEDDPSKRFQSKTFFGQTGTKSANKHINSVASDIANDNPDMMGQKINESNEKDLAKQDGFVLQGKEREILEGLNMIRSKLPGFHLAKFHNNSKMAFDLIIQAGLEGNEDEMQELVDPRYVEHFKEVAIDYAKIVNSSSVIKYEISEIYMFGNTAFIKVMFTQNSNDSAENSLNEEWTFSRNILAEGKTWYLSNIDKI